MIERFVFPEMHTDAPQSDVGVARGNALDTARDAGQRHPRPEEHVHVVRHDHVSVKLVMSQLFAAKDGVLNVAGNSGVAKP